MVGETVALGAGLIVFFIILGLAIFALVIYLFVFWILMIIDCAKRDFKNDTDKIVWILVIIFLHIIGALIYYFVVKRKDNDKIRKRK
jgi:uncharacterized BrkB/YihY/UPF0761 family membrane protein